MLKIVFPLFIWKQHGNMFREKRVILVHEVQILYVIHNTILTLQFCYFSNYKLSAGNYDLFHYLKSTKTRASTVRTLRVFESALHILVYS